MIDEHLEGFLATNLLVSFISEEFDNTDPLEFITFEFDGFSYMENKKDSLAEEIYDCYSEISYHAHKLMEHGIDAWGK